MGVEVCLGCFARAALRLAFLEGTASPPRRDLALAAMRRGLFAASAFDAITGCAGGPQTGSRHNASIESIMTNNDKSAATWSDVKAKLGDFDYAGLLGLVQDLYTTSKDNQNFLHARFGLGYDVLKPYKTIIERWLWPDVYKHQEYSVSKAKKPISDYKEASGLPEGVAELTVYYCEKAISFSHEVGLDDGAYYDALVRMFEQALKTVMALPETRRESLLGRLQDVRASGQGTGWGVEYAFKDLWQRAGLEFDS
jgi:hypothetical protein